tara:strand:+ start:502 stop:1416 length:915 start_codon:yes stop_codon:yes gene_type:complete
MLKLKPLLTEAPEDELAKVFGDKERGGDVAQGQEELSKIISDPKVQAVLKAGEDDGDPDDDKLPYTRIDALPVADLQPTQNEIGFDQSVMNLLTDKFNSLQSFLDGAAKVGGPIVTYDGKYIIDGHHRWSQVFAANPKATMLTLDINKKPGFSHTDILKAVHGAIAADIGKVPEADPKGVNLLDGVTRDQIPAKLLAKNKNVLEIWMKNSPVNVGASGTMEIRPADGEHGEIAPIFDVREVIFQNLEFMIKNGVAPGAPGRKHMPQSDSGGKPIDRLGALAKGTVNVSEPFTDGVIKMKNLLGK